jgi:radical SAM superfamily enzyme with C-terminal helix-hairpin-helix motif
MFGRALGSYPPLVGIVSNELQTGEKTDVMVSARGRRSLTALRCPLDINGCGRRELMALPGIGRARAEFLISKRPYDSRNLTEAIKKTLGEIDAPEIADKLLRYFQQT